jgi:ribonuclease HI
VQSASKPNQVIYVDAGWKDGVGGHIAWFNKTTGKSFYEKRNCVDSFRCEYEAVLRVLEDHKELIEQKEPVEILMDNETVIKQLRREYGINRDDTREIAVKIWSIVGGTNVRFLWISRKLNKAGKMLGS